MFRFRIRLMLVFFTVIIFLLFLRLTYLQYYKSSTYSTAVRNRNIIEERLEPIRGSIYDRNNISIAEQIPSFNLILDPLKFPFQNRAYVLDIVKHLNKAIKMSREERQSSQNELLGRLPEEITKLMQDTNMQRILTLTKQTRDNFEKNLTDVVRFTIKGWVLEPLFFNLKYEEAVAVELAFNGVRGLRIQSQSIRAYPQGNSMAHIIGEIQNLQDEEVEELSRTGKLIRGKNVVVELSNEEHQYLLNKRDISELWVGRSGVEAVFNKELSGVSGEKCTERVIGKNSEGDIVPETVLHYEIPPVVGKDLHLTIDADFQKIAEKVFREKYKTDSNGKEVVRNHVGAFIALDPNTGEVLALVSMPDFDPNALIPPKDSAVVDDVILGKTQPNYLKIFNRVIQSRYPPGSPFKMFVALMGLEDGVIDENFSVFCSGSIKFANGEEFKCHNQYGHQRLDVVKAIKKSCNVFFYTVGMKMGLPRQLWWSKQFGFGQKTGIELPKEFAGHLPSPRLNSKGQPIQNLYVDSHISIGQVDLEATPLQMARAASLFANGGYLITPHLVKDDTKANTKIKLPVKEKNLKIVIEGLFQVVNEAGGTAYAVGRSDEVVILGKTGTADVGGRPIKNNPQWMDSYYRFSQSSYPPHAWFVGFAPRNNPKIAFACVSEYVGHGGDIAAPVVKKILEQYFRLLKQREENEPKG